NKNTTQAQQKALDDALVAPADRQEFEDLPLEQDILSFIRHLGHTGDITYLTDGMFYKKNIDYVYLLWEDFLFQIEYKDAKKTNKMSYLRFTKIIIDYFMSKDQSISKRNKMFWHTARDDTMFTSMRCISRHEYTQTPVQATKGTRIKSKANVAKSDMKKQPTKSKKPKGDGVDTQSKVPDEQHLKTTSADEGTGTIPGVPDIPMYESESEKESWGDNEDEDNENNSDDISDEGDDDNEGNDDDEYDEVTKEFYEDVNVNLEYEGTEMTNADQGALEQQNVSQESRFKQVEEYAHVILTLVLDTQKANEPVQSSFVSSDFTSKLLNLENPSPADNEIASLMETSAHHVMVVPENTSGFIHPPPPFFNPLLQQATPTPIPTTSKATTLFPLLPDFSSVFRFNNRVTNLEKDLSEIKQVD
ncbi:hypothetical protein Tco_0218910, partial [Tanacetum coccineum]